MTNVSKTEQALTAAKIPFIAEDCQGNGFWGHRIRFDRKYRARVERTLGHFVKAYYKECCVEYY